MNMMLVFIIVIVAATLSAVVMGAGSFGINLSDYYVAILAIVVPVIAGFVLFKFRSIIAFTKYKDKSVSGLDEVGRLLGLQSITIRTNYLVASNGSKLVGHAYFRINNIPYLLHPYVSFYASRGCPALCTFCLWPQTMSGHPWRTRSAANVVAEARRVKDLFPEAKEIFFDDDTFPWAKAHVLEVCEALKPLKLTWSCNARVHTDYETLKAMKEAGCRLMVVGFESGDDAILRNIKKGATTEQALEFMANVKKVGLVVHGDFQIGLPGETPETIEKTIEFAKRLDPETIQVSMSHPYPGTEFDSYVRKHGYLNDVEMTDELGHQLPSIQYPGLDRRYMVEMVERFYDRFYFRPKVIWRFVRRMAADSYERARLLEEAKDYFATRAKRHRFARAEEVNA